MQNTYDRCTERVRLALALARAEAQRTDTPGAGAIGPEHLLLGLLRERDGVAAQALRALGLNEERLRWAVAAAQGQANAPPPIRSGWAARWQRLRESFGSRPELERLPPAAEADLTPAVRDVLQRALDDVLRQDHHVIATEHVLLQLVREEQGPAARLLRHVEVTPAMVRQAVHDVMTRASRRGPRI